jgi:ATP-dependent RNA helicase SUPV3L1/SUV3
MLNAEYKQFTVNETGVVLFQKDASNPVPGTPIANLSKGSVITRPKVDVVSSAVPDGVSIDDVQVKLDDWLLKHIHETMPGFEMLADEMEIPQAARTIALKLYGALGVIPRADIEELVKDLDETGRQALRDRKVRMGPLLIYVYTMNKPASVRMRALLWNLWNDVPLPATVPQDGITSRKLGADEAVNDIYFRTIGYPHYAGRIIRVDMLDRLVCEIYDSAKNGTFKADHKMAEWLGCSIPDLYNILEAMGHKKISDPADEIAVEAQKPNEKPDVKEGAVPPSQAEISPQKEKPEEKVEEEPKSEATEAPKTEPPPKPDLAVFRLRQGRAYGAKGGAPEAVAKATDKSGGKKPAHKKPDHKKTAHKKTSGKKPGFKKPQDKERVMSAPSKQETDSPFAVLQALKTKK